MRRSKRADRGRGTHSRDVHVTRRVVNAAATRVVGSNRRWRRRRRRWASPNRDTRARGRAVAANLLRESTVPRARVGFAAARGAPARHRKRYPASLPSRSLTRPSGARQLSDVAAHRVRAESDSPRRWGRGLPAPRGVLAQRFVRSRPLPRMHLTATAGASGKIVRNHRPKRRVHDPRNFPPIPRRDGCAVPARARVSVPRRRRVESDARRVCEFLYNVSRVRWRSPVPLPLRRVDPPPSVFPRFASPPLASLGSTLLSVASFLLTFSWRTGRPTCTSSRLWFGTTPSRWFSRRRRPWCTERSPGPRRRR